MKDGKNVKPILLFYFFHKRSELGSNSLSHLRTFLEKKYSDLYDLRTIDVFDETDLVIEYRISATPCLVKELPDGRRYKLIGKFDDEKTLEYFMSKF